jgi:hypothetical protein
MTKQHFNFDEIFSFAWSKTKQHAWFIACSFLIYAIIMSAVKFNPILGPITALLIGLSMLSMSLTIVRNESFSFVDLFTKIKSPKLVINFFALTVIYGAVVSVLTLPFVAAMSIVAGTLVFGGAFTTKLMVVLGVTTLMLIPGIYVAVRFKFYPYVLLENEHLNVLEVIKQTNKLTCCAFKSLFVLFLAITLLNVVGFLAAGVGLIFTVPVSVFALAHAFRKLEGHSH